MLCSHSYQRHAKLTAYLLMVMCINFTMKFSSVYYVRKQPTLNFSKGGYERVRYLLNEINWEALLGNLSSDESWNVFCAELNK